MNRPGLPNTVVDSLTGGQVMLSKVATPVISWPRSSDSASSLDLVSSLWITLLMWALSGWASIIISSMTLSLCLHSKRSGSTAFWPCSLFHGSFSAEVLPLPPRFRMVLYRGREL